MTRLGGMEMMANPGLLARGAVEGDRTAEDLAAFAALVERQARVMFRVAMSVVRNEADAEDAVQEAFLKLYRTGAWRGIREEKAFVGRVVWRCALDRLEQRRDSAGAEDVTEMQLAAPGESAEARMSNEGERVRLRTLIDGLPEEFRRPLLLSAIEEMTSAEVGAVMRIPEGTVRTRVMRARAELRKRFEAGDAGRLGWRGR